jgi:hypothetical protein
VLHRLVALKTLHRTDAAEPAAEEYFLIEEGGKHFVAHMVLDRFVSGAS